MEKKLFRLGSIFAAVLTALVMTGCDDRKEPPVDTAEVAHARKVVAALDAWIADFNKGIPLTGAAAGKILKVNLEFLPHAEEARLESADFFDDKNWAANSAALVKLADAVNEPLFKEKEKFLAMSVGSSSTQGYYMENGVAKGFGYLFGTTPITDAEQLKEKEKRINKMVDDIVKLGRPVVFIGSLGFAYEEGYVPPQKDTPEAAAEFHPNPMDGSKKFVSDKAGDLANLLVAKFKEKQFKKAYVLKAGKATKLQNKWTRTLVKESAAFANGKRGFVGDIGGNGFSVKFVNELGVFVDAENLVKMAGKSDDFLDQESVVKAYSTEPEKTGIHQTLTGIKKTIFEGIQYWMDQATNKAQFDAATEFPAEFRQTGMLRELYFKMKEIIKSAGTTAKLFVLPSAQTEQFAANDKVEELLAA